MKNFLFLLAFSVLSISCFAQGKQDTITIRKPCVFHYQNEYYTIDSTGVTASKEVNKLKLVMEQNAVEAIWKALDNSNENHVVIRQLQELIANQINRQRK